MVNWICSELIPVNSRDIYLPWFGWQAASEWIIFNNYMLLSQWVCHLQSTHQSTAWHGTVQYKCRHTMYMYVLGVKKNFCYFSSLITFYYIHEWSSNFGSAMDLLHMDIHPCVNEFMHLSLSKVSQKHFRHAFPLWSAWSSPPVSR